MFRKGKKKQVDPRKENLIKTKILDSLAEAVKVIQSENKHSDNVLTLNESTSRLCSVLEALFIHGLKSTFLGRFPLWGGGEFSPRLPEPSFWTFALMYSHKQVISTIEKSSQITTEVGKARAWLRLALNDGLLVSYLMTMTRDKSSLSVHYENYAMLRDLERIDLARSYVTGLEVYAFNLPTNVSMFNSQPLLIRSLAQPIQNNSVVQLGLLNEDEALRLILQSTPVSLPCSPPTSYQLQTDTDTKNYTSTYESFASNEDCGNPSMHLLPKSRSNSRERQKLKSPGVSNPSSRTSSPMRGYRKRQSLSPLAAKTSRACSEERITGDTVPDHITGNQSKPTNSKPGSPTIDKPSQPFLDIYTQRNSSPKSDLDIRKSPSPEPIRGQTVSRSSSNSPVPVADNDDKIHENIQEDEEMSQQTANRSDSYTLSRTSSPCRPSAAPSMEWEEEFPPQGRGGGDFGAGSSVVNALPADLAPQPNSLEAELQLAEQTNQEMEKSASSGSSDRSCTCSTQGPDPECQLCASVQLKPRTRIHLSEYVEPDTSSTDQISLEGERKRRRQSFKIGFRKSPDLSIPEFSLQRNLDLVSCLDIIPRELGLHTQDWRCIDCTKAIGALFGNGKVCAFTKKHYCEDCHVDDMSVIPSRLLYNWDGKSYPVAKSSFRFLQLARTLPIIKIREFNPKLVDFVPSIDPLMSQRKKLHYMHAYLTACSRADDMELLNKLVAHLGGRDYLCTGTEMFSLMDMEEVHSGQMATLFKTSIDICAKHIDSCLVCSGRGFICEICKEKRPVYPFNLDTTSQCADCFTVFHSTCAKSIIQCPRCERISSRALNSLIVETRLTRELRNNI